MFDIEVVYAHRSDIEHRLRVMGTKAPFAAARLDGHPEDRRPAEGGEIDAAEIRLCRGRRERKLPAKLVHSLMWDPERLPAKIDKALEASWN